jgi:NAD(P)-dependent dehydrogenase (short-subunit alcohol dehydrogenase family)
MATNGLPFNFSGKGALVPSGNRAIGRATAQLFSQSGAKTVIGDIDSAGSQTVAAIKDADGDAVL